jgi:hypothetical protein
MRAITSRPPGTEVKCTPTIAVKVVVKQPRHARVRPASRSRIVRLLDIVDSIAVAAGRAVVALGREHVHEVEEADVAVAAGGESAAVRLVVTRVERGSEIADLLAFVVGADGVVALGDEGGVVVLLGRLVVAEAGRVVVVVGALDVGAFGAGGAQPAVAVGVGGPEGDLDAVAGGDVGEGGVALDELGTHRVCGDDDLVHVGELVAVRIVGNDLVEDVEGGHAFAGGWVGVGESIGPIVVVPDQGIGGRCARGVVIWVGDVLV